MKKSKLSLIGKIAGAMALAFMLSSHSNATEIKVLFIGRDVGSEIPAYLTSLVSEDSSLTDTINAEFYWETDVLHAYYENRLVPSDSNTLLAKLDEGFDYVFVQPEEEALFKYPGLSLEEIRLVQKHLQGSGASVVIPMIWGDAYGTDAEEFEDHSYRIGDALGVDVVPAGLAWVEVLNDVASVANSGPDISLTAEASYLMAAAAYVYIFEQSATNSAYTPSGITTKERNAILAHSYSNWVSASTESHYTGAYTNGFCSPLQIPFDVTNTKCVFLGSSTEVGYGSKWASIMSDGGYNAGRTHVNRYAYPGSPIFPDLIYESGVSNILAGTYYDFACARFNGEPTTGEYEDLRLYSKNPNIPFIGFRYQGSDIPNTLNGISSKAFWAADHAYNANTNTVLGHGSVFNLPVEIAFGRLWDRSEDLVKFGGVHVSDYVDAAAASMIYTMMTGDNCTAFGHPGSMGQQQEQYEYAQNLGYTIIQQLGSLKKVTYDEANTAPAAIIGTDASAHSSPNNSGGGVFYFVDSDENGSELCAMHATNSYDYEGSVTGYIWSDQGTQVSTSAGFTNLVDTGSASIWGLAAIDDLSQTSIVSKATIRVLDPSTLLHDDQDVATSGGFGWADAAWTINNTRYVQWDTKKTYNGSRSLNLQQTGQASRHTDLSSATNDVIFEFQWKGASLEEEETATVEVYDGSWHTLLTVDSLMADGAWHAESIVLSAYNLTSPVEIRFTVAGNDNKDDLYIDAMRIYSTDPSPPVATDDAYAVEMNVTLTNATPGVLENDTDVDGDALTASLVSTTTNGTLVLAEDGAFTYQPDLDATGIDTFTYEAIDATGLTSSEATVTLTITAPSTQILVTYNFNTGLDASTSGSALTAGTLSYAVGTQSDGEPTTALRGWDQTSDPGDYRLSFGQRGLGNLGTADAALTMTGAATLRFTLTPTSGEALDFSSSTLTLDQSIYADSGNVSFGYKVWADKGDGFKEAGARQTVGLTHDSSGTENRLLKTDEENALPNFALSNGIIQSKDTALNFDLSSLGVVATNQSVTLAIAMSSNKNNQFNFGSTFDNLTLELNLFSSAGYTAWATFYELVGGETDDDDGDGLSNIHEFGMGGNPTNSTDIGYEPIVDMVEDTSTNWMRYVHVRLADPSSGITYLLEETPDLVQGSWTNANATQIGTPAALPADPNFESITNRIPTTETQKFIRLKIKKAL